MKVTHKKFVLNILFVAITMPSLPINGMEWVGKKIKVTSGRIWRAMPEIPFAWNLVEKANELITAETKNADQQKTKQDFISTLKLLKLEASALTLAYAGVLYKVLSMFQNRPKLLLKAVKAFSFFSAGVVGSSLTLGSLWWLVRKASLISTQINEKGEPKAKAPLKRLIKNVNRAYEFLKAAVIGIIVVYSGFSALFFINSPDPFLDDFEKIILILSDT